MSEEDKKVKVGVGVMIFKDGKVLVGRRKNSHGDGEYSFPGGNLEYMEGFEECTQREVLEEAGIKIKNIKFLSVGNVIKYKPKHYVNIEFIADWESGRVQSFENEKIDSWNWYSLNDLPSPLFEFTKKMIDNYKSDKNYYDKE